MSSLHLFTIPPEILLEILEFLDCKTLLTCRQVCTSLKRVVDETATAQYEIELYASATANNPRSSKSTSARLEILKNYQKIWDDQKWNRQHVIPMQRGGLWELYGGVLGQSTPKGSFVFYRLPSEIRGIQEKTWELKKPAFKVRDFGLDPSQDLLVLIQKPKWSSPNDDHAHRFHLLSLEKSPGEPHPLAAGGTVLSHVQSFRDIEIAYTIQISGDYVGVLVNTMQTGRNELMVWNWKTGHMMVDAVGDQIRTFSFLSDEHILLGALSLREDEEENIVSVEPTLTVINFKQEGNSKRGVTDLTTAVVFNYPALHENVGLIAFEVRSDPTPTWAPNPDLDLPFYLAKHHRLYVVTLWLQVFNGIRCLMIFLPSSTLMPHLDPQKGDFKRRLDWEDWGPQGTRMIVSPHSNSHVWVCFVYGTKYVAREAPLATEPTLHCRLYDFNELALRREMPKAAASDILNDPVEGLGANSSTTPTQKYQIGPTVIPGGEIFDEEVMTYLPYRWKRVTFQNLPRGPGYAVMCSEDNLLVVDTNRNQYHIYTL